MDRGILYARVRLSTAHEILLTTTHLESWAGEDHNGSTQRQSQILEMEAFCVETVSKHPNVHCALITGDLNWDDERARSVGPDPLMLKHLKKPWKDAWVHLHGDNKKAIGYTYDSKLNPMLGGNLRRRFDRILLYPDNASQVQRTEFLGKEVLPGLSWEKTNPYNNSVRSVPVAPSDHFGLLAQITVEVNLT
jgi:endonuclease/exonuclease/phosphatase family metal-dependent hydrolase